MLTSKLLTVVLVVTISTLTNSSCDEMPPRGWRSYLFLFPGPFHDQLLLVRDGSNSRSRWELPGGGSEDKDKCAPCPIFMTMKREYEEETGTYLPELTDFDSFENGDHHYFYYGKSGSLNLLSNHQLFGDGEVSEWKLFAMTDLPKLRGSHSRALNTAVQRGIISSTRGLSR
eukprot:GFUD01115193.1.p1 GENE.GFUD01115193.1~~GFUD01115193.1.p1  ORF type:complete len:172 (+),score=39.02 GFUD01115193.1:46-561(+)